jgi:tRNA(His) 5'-end guanylyltransferase
MKLALTGNMLIVTSQMKTEAFKKALKVKPETNVVVDEDGNDVFKISFDDTLKVPKFNKFSATFNQTSQEGFMEAVIPLTPSEDANEVIVEEYGNALHSAKSADKIVAESVAAVNNSMSELLDSIE